MNLLDYTNKLIKVRIEQLGSKMRSNRIYIIDIFLGFDFYFTVFPIKILIFY